MKKKEDDKMHYFERKLSTALIVAFLAANMSFPSIPINAAQSNKATSSNAIDDDFDDEIELFMVDRDRPVIKSITAEDVDKIPGTLHFTVDVEEEGSGLREIAVRIENRNNGKYVNKTYSFPAETYSGECQLEFNFTDKSLPSGDWQIYAYAADYNGNYSGGFQTFNTAKFHLNGNSDFTPPTVHDIRIVSEKIEIPDNMVIDVEAEDESGIASISMTLIGEDAYGNQSKVSKTFNFDPDEQQDSYRCVVPMQKTYVSGLYKIGMITISDGVNNWTSNVADDYSSESCEVVNFYRDDNTPPEITNISFESASGRAPYNLNIAADVVEDGSGLSSMVIRLVNTSTNKIQWVSVPVDQNDRKSGTYKATTQFSDEDDPGIWRVDCAVIDDVVGNDNYYQESFGCEFELLEPIKMEDIYVKTLPVKTSYQIGEELDLDGLTVIGKYTDGTERKLAHFAVGEFDSSAAGEKEIVVTYDIFKTSFKVSVTEPVKSDDIVEDDKPNNNEDAPKQEENTANSSNSTSTIISSSSGKSHGSGGSGGGGSSSGGSRSAAVVQSNANTYPTLTVTNPYVYGGQWQQVENKWKFLVDGSAMKSSWICLDGKWYLIGEDTYMIIGWAQVNGACYYFGADGAMATNEVFIGEKKYKFAENGAWIPNYTK